MVVGAACLCAVGLASGALAGDGGLAEDAEPLSELQDYARQKLDLPALVSAGDLAEPFALLLHDEAAHHTPLALTAAQEQVRQHLVVLGNAAHSLHPIAGQGYNLSLRDTLELAESLLASTAPLGELACLQGYLDRQRLDQQMTVGFSDQVTKLFTTGQPLLVAGRNLGLLGLDLLPPAKRWFARQAMGLGPRSV